MKKNIIKLVIFLLISVALIYLDIITKNLAISYLSTGREIELIEGVLSFLYVENRGAAFGIMYGQQWIFYIITIVVLAFLAGIVWRIPLLKRYTPMYIVLLFIFSGATGNFIDRLQKQYVVDFIYFKLIDFPVFNVADIYITIGCFLMMLLFLFFYREDELSFLYWRKKNAA